MDSKIDFSSYTLEELHSAASAIDSEQYPERAEEINQLIQEWVVIHPEEEDNSKIVGDKATRGDRFIAALIDGVINLILAIPIFIYLDFEMLADPTLVLSVTLLLYGVIVGLIAHGYLLYHYGQTIGKNFMSIRIENLDDTKASFTTILFKRIIPMQVLSIVPLVGQFISGIVNVLFIFGKQKRCLHDYLAKTKVCYTNN